MKTHKLLTLALCFATSTLFAQTADQYVTQGRNSLVAHDLAGAYSNFNAAVTLSPTHETANALLAVTRLLVLPQQPAGSNFLNTLGFAKSGRNFYNWTSSLPVDVDGHVLLPSVNTSVAIAFYRTNIMLALGASGTNLSRITNPGFTLALTASETSGEAVTVDYGDILLMQAELYAAEFLGYTLNAQNFNVVFSHLQAISETDELTVQRVLADYPSLLTQNNAADLANSKGPFTNAIALYQAASDFIRNNRPPGQGLFILEPNDLATEENFRDSLTNVLLSLNGPVQFSPNDTFSLYAGAYFAGAKSLRSLMPQFSRNRYVFNTLPDYTLGGFLVGEPACDVEALLRKLLDRPDAGIYTGTLSDAYYGGGFAVYLGTDLQATLVGYDNDREAGAFAQFRVDDGGSWSFVTNRLSDAGPYTLSAQGTFDKHGSFFGEFDFSTTNGIYLFSEYLDGNLASPQGGFQGAAGNYSGSWSGGGYAGKLYGELTADGSIYYASLQSDGRVTGGGMAQIDASYHFTNSDVSGTVVIGTLNPSAHALSGTFTSPGSSGTWSLSRSTFAPFDVPPVITSNLPPIRIAPLGTNVMFFLVATGSPPMCYQWYSNGFAIPNAITNTLVVSNLQYASAGTYSVTISNVVGGTNAAVTLTVTAETIPPVLSITNVTAGMSVSNGTFTVKGTTHDNVAVSNVFCSLNNGIWTSATTANNWSNWTAVMTLVPGTNKIAAYAVDTSGNVSATNSVNLVDVLSATLTVSTNGLGSLSPNYNGALLQIGKGYAITATAGTGFAFTNWMGGTSLPLTLLTNGPTIQFVMVTNLTLQANFVDITKPTLSITNVTAGMGVSNASFTVKGTAGDNVAVANVFYSLNNADWSNALTANNWSNWTAAVTLVPGTNKIAAYAMDATGNKSTTNTLNFIYVVSATLNVSTNGLGALNPNYNGALLQIGKGYAITATAGTGFAFTNWTGGTSLPLTLLTNGPTVQFVMVTNLMLQANFVDVTKPTLTISVPTAGQHMTNAMATVVGTAGDNWKVNAVWYLLSNSILTNGTWSLALSTNSYTNWTTTVTLAAGTNTMKAYAMDRGGNLSTTSSVSVMSSNTFQLQLAFTNALPLTTNGLVFSLQLSPGLNGHIQTSTNLATWTMLTNFVGTNSTLNFRDPAATNFILRYYRAVVP